MGYERSGRRPWWLTRFSQSSLPAKGLFLITAPVFIQLLFLLVFALIRNKIDEDRHLSVHSKNVLLLSQKALNDYTIGYNRALVSVISRQSGVGQTAQDRLAAALVDIERLGREIADNPQQIEQTTALEASLRDFKTTIEQILRLSAAIPDSSSTDRDSKVGDLSNLLTSAAEKSNSLHKHFERVIDLEVDLDRERTSRFRNSFRSLYWLFVAGAVVMIVGAWSLHRFLSETFWKRVQAVIRNVKSVSHGSELTQPLPGTDEIAQIDQAIHLLAQVLKEKSAETELFIYSVSHDLRSPLVNLHGFSEELKLAVEDIQRLAEKKDGNSDIDAEIARIVDKDLNVSLRFIRVAGERMANIIDSLLSLSRAGRIEYTMEKVDLKQVVSTIISSLSGTVAGKRATVSIGDLPVVVGDKAALEQVFQNLVQNALKYADTNREPLIEIGLKDSEGSLSTVFVKDNGLGIPESAMPKLFVAFRRFHPDVATGDGIGLAISRQTVIRHRGNISCESRTGAGSGSTFYVSLPTWRERDDGALATHESFQRSGHL